MNSLSRRIALASFVTSLWLPQVAFARSFRVDDIPNGYQKDCANCHLDGQGDPRNEFGSDAQAALDPTVQVRSAHVDWSELCPQDSDSDGWTNGEELGDPNCTWVRGDADPNVIAFNPGSDASHPPSVCGNGLVQIDEDCEGGDVGGLTCSDVGAGDGQLACGDDCDYDYSGCSDPPVVDEGTGGGGSAGSALPTGSSESGCAVAAGHQAGPTSLRCISSAGWLLLAAVVRRRHRRVVRSRA